MKPICTFAVCSFAVFFHPIQQYSQKNLASVDDQYNRSHFNVPLTLGMVTNTDLFQFLG